MPACQQKLTQCDTEDNHYIAHLPPAEWALSAPSELAQASATHIQFPPEFLYRTDSWKKIALFPLSV